MQDQHPAAEGQPVRQEGNRPAHNARLSTPGAMGAGSVPAGEGAGDFLGLGEELGVPGAPQARAPSPPAPAPQPAPPPAAPPQAEIWEEYNAQAEGDEAPLEEVVSLDEGGSLDEVWEEYDEGEPAYEEDEGYDEEDYDDEGYDDEAEPPPGVLAAWREEEPARRGRGKLFGVCLGVGIVGMMAVAGLQLVNASREVRDALPEPLAAHSNPLPYANQVVPPTTPGDGPVEPMRFVLDASGNEVPTETRAGFEPQAFDPTEQARSAFEAARGDAPPPGFDPVLDTPAAPASLAPDAPYEGSPMGLEHGSRTGRAEPASDPAEPVVEVAQAAPAIEEPPADTPLPEEPEVVSEQPSVAAVEPPAADAQPLELVAEGPARDAPVTADPPAPEEPAVELVAGTDPQPEPEPVELAAETPEVSDPLPPPAQQPGAPQPAATTPSAWLQIALQRSRPPQGQAATQGGPPPAPEPVPELVQAPPPSPGATPQSPGTSPVEALIASREPRPTRVVAPAQVPPPEATGNLRQASSSDLAGVWRSTALPVRAAFDHPERVLTPNVGRVRVLLHSKDVFEGRLYAVGEGNVWIESEHGRMALQGARVASIEQLTSRDGTPVLGDTGSQDLAGMERVRVKTPGGTFYGKVISRDEKTTTLVTDDGARLTLDSKMVELLVDAPKVTIKGTAPDKEVADTKKP